MSGCPFQAFDDCQEEYYSEEDGGMCPNRDNCYDLKVRGNCIHGHTNEEIDEAFVFQKAADEAREQGRKVTYQVSAPRALSVAFPSRLPSQPTGSADLSLEVCKYFLHGKCRYGDKCKKMHSVMGSADVPTEVCQYYLRGTCEFGDKCWDRHPPICMDFLNGECPFGDECNDAHIIEN